MIKAIETEYKGYRFRSRLEARWAVFFDTLGIAWEYEKEGYDLGEAGWYLPDFWLPKSNAWLEIKPDIADIKTGSPKVFCAGKVGGHNHCEDWRYKLIKGDFFFLDEKEYLNNPIGNSLDMIAGCQYVGPYSFDNLGGHGSGNARIWENHGSYELPQVVIEDCQERIRIADIVFAWIDTEDCFGTLVEIGFAAALKKEIWIAYPPKHQHAPRGEDDDCYIEDRAGNNLWYAFAHATKERCAATPEEAFVSLRLEMFSPEQRKSQMLAVHSGKPVLMLQGNPWPGEYKLLVFGNQKVERLRSFDADVLAAFKAKNTNLQAAFAAARSARFEHGEHGTR